LAELPIVRQTEPMTTNGLPQRVALLSVHTSPLDQPGTGDAGGMNVYVLETARRLAQRGIEVEVFTRATSSRQPALQYVEPGLKVRSIAAGPFEGLAKEDLPAQMCAMTAGVMRVEAAHPEGWFDLVHSHYWLSGQVGWLTAERWNVPLVHSMHTLARVKNQDLAAGDKPEPHVRLIGEDQVVAASTRLIANTELEATQLVNLYHADRNRIDVVHPGVDLATFSPGSRDAARRSFGIGADEDVLLFVGRIQPLKAPDVLLEAAAIIKERSPDRKLRVIVCGGPSGSGLEQPTALIDLSRSLGITDIVKFQPPTDRTRLADLYRAADITVVPSYNESFGLVAVESQACGTPVVAADVGGLRTAVSDQRSGLLIPGHNPYDYGTAIAALLDEPNRLSAMGVRAREQAEGFSWDITTDGLINSYSHAIAEYRNQPLLSVVS
jgi:D-inositol-3-phosphate glycosyltransferase